MILCGWCHHPTDPEKDCQSCGHPEPEKPWVQRGLTPVAVTEADVRAVEHRKRLDVARRELEEQGQRVTHSALADALGVDERTVRRWMSAK